MGILKLPVSGATFWSISDTLNRLYESICMNEYMLTTEESHFIKLREVEEGGFVSDTTAS